MIYAFWVLCYVPPSAVQRTPRGAVQVGNPSSSNGRRGGGMDVSGPSERRGLPVVVIDSSDDSGSSSSSDISGSTMGEEQHDAEVRFPSCPCNCGSVHVLNKV